MKSEVEKDLNTHLHSLVFSPIVQKKINDRQNIGGDDQEIEGCEGEECGRAELNDDCGHRKSGYDDRPQEYEPKNVFSSLQSSVPILGHLVCEISGCHFPFGPF